MTRLTEALISAVIGFWHAMGAFHTAVLRIMDLSRSIGRSDGDARPTPYSALSTSSGHQRLAAWFALGALCAGVAPWTATLMALVPPALWEIAQYRRQPGVKFLRDGLLYDGSSYLVGAWSVPYVIGGAVAGNLTEWAVATAAIVVVSAVVTLAQGRVPE
jgi:hypothetical protein